GGDVPARLPVRVPAGDGVPRGVDGTGPEALDGYLRLHVLHVDRLPWSARDDRRHHAHHHLAARGEGALHAAASLRFRSGGVVLALRRRGVAWAVYFRLLVIRARGSQ